MADYKITVDDTDVLAALDRIAKRVEETGKKADGIFDGAFDTSEAKAAVGVLNTVQKELEDIKKAADTLKAAMKNATDPAIIKSYAEQIAKLEKGMETLSGAAKAVGVNVNDAKREVNSGKEVFENFFGAFTKASLIVAAISYVKKFATEAIDAATKTDKATKQFTAFLGSVDKASATVAKLQSFANKKLFNTDEILAAGKSLLAFGENADNLEPVLSRIADISRATGKDFGELTTIYGKARAAGVLYAEDINQLVDAGIPIIGQFAKQLGVSTSQVKKLASEGKISFEQLQLAFFNLTAQGGLFKGQAEAGATAGERFEAVWSKALNTVGKALKPAWDTTVNSLSNIVESVASLGESDGFGDFAKRAVGVFISLNPALQKFKKEQQGAFFSIETKEEIDTRLKLEAEAAKTLANTSKKSAAELAAIEKERQQLRIDALKDGEAKEIALENLRFNELVKALKKYHIDTSQAEEQHKINLIDIEVKFASERAAKAKELMELRKAEVDFEAAKAKELVELRKAQGEFEAEQAVAEKNRAEKLRDLKEAEIKITEAEFDNLIAALKAGGASEADIKQAQNAFDLRIKRERIEAEIDYQKKILALAGNGVEAEIIKKRIQELGVILDGLDIQPPSGSGKPKPKSIFDLLGISFADDDQKKAFEQAVASIKDSLGQIAEARVREAEKATAAADEKVKAAEDAYNKELEYARKGEANFAALRQSELENAKKSRDQALKEESKARKQQLALDSLGQISGLITSSVNIFQSLSKIPFVGIPLAIATIGLMFGAFAKVKADAFKAANAPKLRKGLKFTGPSHDAGNEDLVVDGNKKVYAVEGDEWLIGTKPSREHDRFLQNLNSGRYSGLNLVDLAERARGKASPSPIGQTATRIHALQKESMALSEAQHYKALAKAYEISAEKITAEIRRKPIGVPWKDGYKLITDTGSGVHTHTVNPAK